MIKTAPGLHARIKGMLAGVAKGRVAHIVAKGARLGQIFIKAQTSRNRTRDLGDLKAVGQARSEMIAFMGNKDLGFAF
jgi:hypothetical protein